MSTISPSQVLNLYHHRHRIKKTSPPLPGAAAHFVPEGNALFSSKCHGIRVRVAVSKQAKSQTYNEQNSKIWFWGHHKDNLWLHQESLSMKITDWVTHTSLAKPTSTEYFLVICDLCQRNRRNLLTSIAQHHFSSPDVNSKRFYGLLETVRVHFIPH